MRWPRLIQPADIVTWAGKLVAQLERAFNDLATVQRQGDRVQLPVLAPTALGTPSGPGEMVCVADGALGTVLLISNAAGVWLRADDRTVYSP